MLRTIAFTLTATFLVNTAVSQDLPVQRSSTVGEAQPQEVHLSHGMHRYQINQLLGEPNQESIIGALRRTKSIYSNNTTITYVNDLAVMLTTGQKTTPLAGGAVEILWPKRRVVVAADLWMAPAMKHSPNDYRHELLRPSFWFAAPRCPAGFADGLHFTPHDPLFGPEYVPFHAGYHGDAVWPGWNRRRQCCKCDVCGGKCRD